jgi:hypothetical protein
LHWQLCGFLSDDAAGNFTDLLKSAALQQARYDVVLFSNVR